MARTAPFDAHPDRFDEWYEHNEAAYRSELRALRSVWPEGAEGLAVGVGTGRFAAPLDIGRGVDPSREMRKRARERGIAVDDGVAEDLPYSDERFDAVLLMVTLCYVDDPERAVQEAYRVLRPGGVLVIGVIDRDGPLGRRYAQERGRNPFYAPARFHATRDVVRLIRSAGFEDIQTRQTLFSDPDTMDGPDPVRDGSGEGSFAVVRGTKPADS